MLGNRACQRYLTILSDTGTAVFRGHEPAVIVARLRYRPSPAQMVGHIDHDPGLAATLLAKQQHGFELERGLVMEQVLPPAARHNFWEDDHR